MLSKSNFVLRVPTLENICSSMSQEPITEQLPCEYCQQLFSAKKLHSHEVSIQK